MYRQTSLKPSYKYGDVVWCCCSSRCVVHKHMLPVDLLEAWHGSCCRCLAVLAELWLTADKQTWCIKATSHNLISPYMPHIDWFRLSHIMLLCLKLPRIASYHLTLLLYTPYFASNCFSSPCIASKRLVSSHTASHCFKLPLISFTMFICTVKI